jgi:hypothetical protein
MARLNANVRPVRMTRHGKTAEELMRDLEADPQWVRARDERERARLQHAALYAVDEAELVREIRALGYDIDSVYDLVNNSPHPVLVRRFTGPYERAYPVLVKHLATPHHPRIREAIIRALTVRDGGPLVQQALLQQFEAETDPELKWVLANALRIAMPYRERKKHPQIAEAYRAVIQRDGQV